MSVLKYKDSNGVTQKVGAPKIDVYSKTETDTLLQNKAPAGYGLGGQSKFLSPSDDLNNVVYNGWYYFERPPINAPQLDSANAIGWSSMLVSNRSPLYVTQEIFCYASWEVFNCILRRCKINNEWKPWEWVDPPMMPGEEYRTTERYFGKPVYRYAFSTGKLASGINKFNPPVFESGNCRVFRIDATDGYNLPILANHSQLDGPWNIFITEGSCGNVILFCGANQVGSSVDIVLHYTRVTD